MNTNTPNLVGHMGGTVCGGSEVWGSVEVSGIGRLENPVTQLL